MQTRKIQFTEDTVIDVMHVGRRHIGRVQLRANDGDDPELVGGTEYYFPAGTILEVEDYVGSGVATIIPAPEIES
jgi:hypothetical protein